MPSVRLTALCPIVIAERLMLDWLRWLVVAGIALLIFGVALSSCGGGGSTCVPETINQYGQIVYTNCGTVNPPGPYLTKVGICLGTPVPTATPTPVGSTATAVPTPVISPCPSPSALTVPPGCQLQFHAIGGFSDGSNSDVTNSLTFTTTNSAAVAVGASPGLFASQNPGSSNNMADLGAVTGNVSSAPVPVAVQSGASCP